MCKYHISYSFTLLIPATTPVEEKPINPRIAGVDATKAVPAPIARPPTAVTFNPVLPQSLAFLFQSSLIKIIHKYLLFCQSL